MYSCLEKRECHVVTEYHVMIMIKSWLELIGVGWQWLAMVGDGCRWLAMVGNGRWSSQGIWISIYSPHSSHRKLDWFYTKRHYFTSDVSMTWHTSEDEDAGVGVVIAMTVMVSSIGSVDFINEREGIFLVIRVFREFVADRDMLMRVGKGGMTDWSKYFRWKMRFRENNICTCDAVWGREESMKRGRGRRTKGVLELLTNLLNIRIFQPRPPFFQRIDQSEAAIT